MNLLIKSLLTSFLLLFLYNNARATVSFGTPTNSSLPVTFGSAGGNYRIVVIKPASSSTSYPASGFNQSYSSASTNYGDGTHLGNNNYVVYAGTGTGSITVTGLSSSTYYTVMVYECDKVYYSLPYYSYFYTYTTPAEQSGSEYTVATQPSTQASNLVLTATTTTLTISWTAGTGSYEIVTVRPSGYSEVDPTDGTGYTASSTYGSGTYLGSGNYVVYSGSGNTVKVTNLSPGLLYYVSVYTYSGSGNTANYLTSTSLSGNKYTLASSPATQALKLGFSSVTPSSMYVSWVSGENSGGGNTAGELLTIRPYGNTLIYPDNGNSGYTGNSIYGSGTYLGSGNYVIYNGASNNVTVTNLNAGTQYEFAVFTYNGSTNSYDYGYPGLLTPATGSRYTLSTEPSTAPASVTATSITATSFTGSWTNGNGSKRVAIVRPQFESYYAPVDGTNYTANTVYGSGSNLGSNNYIVYNDAGSSVNVTGLSPATSYFLIVYEYNYNAASTQTNNYSPSYGYTLFSTVNTPPGISPVSNVTVCQAAGATALNLSGISSGGEPQTISITATSSNTSLVPHPTITYTSPNATALLGYTPSATSSGTALITLTINDGGPNNNITVKTFSVTVSPLPADAGALSGNLTVCQGQGGYAYSIPAVANATGYTWVKPNGSSIGSGTNSITLNFNATAVSGSLKARGDNSCGSGAYSNILSLNVLEKPTTASAGADQSICTGTASMSANTPTVGTGQWSQLDGTGVVIISPNSPNTNVTGLVAGSLQYARLIWTITSPGQCVSRDTVKITAASCPVSADFYASNTQPCTGSATITFHNNSFGYTSCSWNFGSGSTPSVSTSTVSAIVVTYTTSGSKDVTLSVSGPGGSANSNKTSYINVLNTPGAAGSITGAAPVCQGTSGVAYSISAVGGATGYTWTFPPGAAIASGTNTNSVLVDFSGSASTGTVTVKGTNVCGNGAISGKTVTVNPLPGSAGTIGGPGTVCQEQSGATFTVSPVANATSYTWTFLSTSSVTATNTLSAGVPTNAISGSLHVYGSNSCGQGSVSPSFSITVDPLPGDADPVTGPLVVCQGQTAVSFSIAPVANATSYNWIQPAGSSLSSGNGTNSVLFDFNTSALSGNVRARGNNACGNGKYSPILNLTVDPLPDSPGGISGDLTVCQGESGVEYAVSTINNASGYDWSLPLGVSIAFGENTNAVNIDFSESAVSGNVSVAGTNACGTGTSSSFPVIIKPLAGAAAAISGAATVCQGQQSVVYSTSSLNANDTTFNWSLPPGAIISAGNNTGAITVDFAADASAGNISVYGSNSCGSGDPSPNLALTVNQLPDAAGTIAGSSNVKPCEGADGVAYSIAAVANATGYNWTVPAGVSIVSGSNTNAIIAKSSSGASSESISVAATNACGAGTASSFSVTYVPVPSPEICFITVDSVSKNIQVTWQKPDADDIDSFRVYREVSTNDYKVVRSVPASAYSSIIDTSANANTTYYRYKVASVDTCGNISSLSAYHSNMFLQANLGSGSVINLNWAAYEGNMVDNYRIMRDNDSTGVFVKIDSVPGSTTQYTDNDAASYTRSRYLVEVVWQSECAPSYKTGAASINTSRSNLKDKASIVANSISEGTDLQGLVNVYPNPSSGSFNIEYPAEYGSCRVLIYNVQGTLVHSQIINGQQREISPLNLTKGFYMLTIEARASKAHKKLIIE